LKTSNSSAIPVPEITTIARGAGTIFIGMILGAGLRFLFEFIVARNLGPDLFGLFFLGLSVLKLAEIISTLGLHRGVLRYVALYQGVGDEPRIKGTILFSLRATLAVGFGLGILILTLSRFAATAVFHKAELASILRLFAVAVPFTALTTILVFATQGFKIMRYRVYVRELFEPASRILLVIGVAVIGWKLYGAVFSFVISLVLGTVLALYFIKKIFPSLTDKGLKSIFESRDILNFSWPLLLADFFGLIVIWINILMIGYFKASDEVGIYSAAHRTALLGEVILISFNAIFSPIVADLYNRKEIEKLARLFKIVTKWIFSLSLPLCLLMLFFASDILHLFGQKYIPGATCLVLLSIAQLVNSALGSSGFLIMMSGKSRLNLINNFIAALLNIGLNVLLIPPYGIVGAALSFLTSVSAVNIIMIIEVYALYRMHPFRADLYKPVLAGGVAYIIILLLTKFLFRAENSLLSIAIGSVIYLLSYASLMYALGIEDEDKIILEKFRAKLLASK
jgi:O-antigen/teichoic acid export membrane protein